MNGRPKKKNKSSKTAPNKELNMRMMMAAARETIKVRV